MIRVPFLSFSNWDAIASTSSPTSKFMQIMSASNHSVFKRSPWITSTGAHVSPFYLQVSSVYTAVSYAILVKPSRSSMPLQTLSSGKAIEAVSSGFPAPHPKS